MAPTQKKPAKGPLTYVANAPVGEGSIHLVRTVAVDFGDQSVWARSLVNARRRKGVNSPSAVDFENAITGIQITDTIDGFSHIVVKFEDPEWKLIRSGFFDCNEDGQLDALDVNYPAGSALWWRSDQVSVNANRASAQIELTLIERAAAHLLHKKGPLKTSRAKRTRAEFIADLVHRVKAAPLEFYCQQLHEKQQIEADNRSTASAGTFVPIDDAGKPITVAADRKKAKKKGIHAAANVTIKGKKPDQEQLEAIDVCMKVADRLNAPPRAVWAMCTAAIGESDFRPSAEEHVYGTHKGVFQSGQIPQFDTKQQATYFLKGGRSFLAGGAIGMVKAHPQYSVGTVAAKVEISDGSAAYYDGFAGEAKAIIEAYGGGGLGSTAGGDTEYRKQYNFEVGGPDHPGESFWEAMVRLKNDVKWAMFVDGDSVYFDAETTLIRAKPAAYIDRLDESVVSFSSTWDARNIATEATLILICDPFEFRAGDVLVLRNFGPASSGSSVTPPLPGRWLVSEIDRDRFDFVSTFRLKQPEAPGKEPAAEIGHRKAAGGGAGGNETFQEGAKGVLKWVKSQVGTQEGSAKQIQWAADFGLSSSLPWCSIFVGAALKKNTNLSMPSNPAYSGGWTSWKDGTEVGKTDIQPGDLVIFDWGDGGQTDHVAMYVGGGRVIGGNQSNKVSNVPWDRGHTVAVVHPHYHDTDSAASPPSHTGINTKEFTTLSSGKVIRQ